MSTHKRKPNIRLDIPYYCFNLLISAICENSDNAVESANSLYDKLMKYSRPHTNAEINVESVDIRLFPAEAVELIWQLLIVCGGYVEVVDDFYSRLKESHITKERKNKSE